MRASVLLAVAAATQVRGDQAIVTKLEGHRTYAGTGGQSDLYVSHLGAGSTDNPPTILVGSTPCDIQSHTSTPGRLHCRTRPVDLGDVKKFGLPFININNQKARGVNLPVTVITSKGQVADCATPVSSRLQRARDAHHPRTASYISARGDGMAALPSALGCPPPRRLAAREPPAPV
jgi:hypothetical protein